VSHYGHQKKHQQWHKKRQISRRPRPRPSGPNFSRFAVHEAIDFPGIFGTNSLDETIAVLIRLHRAKRIHGGGTAKVHWPRVAGLAECEDVLPGRRYHHLTSFSRHGMPYRGNDPANLLLMRRRRHAKYHQYFGNRTLEEVIILLLCLHRVGRTLCNFLRDCYSRSCGRMNAVERHYRDRFLFMFCARLERFEPA
jgi:hypothetical protein